MPLKISDHAPTAALKLWESLAVWRLLELLLTGISSLRRKVMPPVQCAVSTLASYVDVRTQ